GNLTDSGTVSFTDVDLTDTHSAVATFVSSTNAGGGQLGALTTGTVTDTVNGTGGSVAWSYSVSDNAVDFLAKNQTITETYSVKVSDNNGGFATQNVTVTITGTNEDPVITANTNGAVTEDTNITAGNLTDSGTLSFTDVDLSDSHTAAASFVSSTNAGGTQLGTLSTGAVTDTVNGTGGSVAWSYSVSDNAVDFLAAGQTITETYSVKVSDNHRGFHTQDVTVTIT